MDCVMHARAAAVPEAEAEAKGRGSSTFDIRHAWPHLTCAATCTSTSKSNRTKYRYQA